MASADYYNNNNNNNNNTVPPVQQGYVNNQQQPYYGQQQQPPYANGNTQNYAPPAGAPYDQPKYNQQPPTYDQNYNFGPTNYAPQGDKADFGQTFKLEKAKWNDLWAGILFILVFLGFAAVSGISIQGYAAHRTANGGGGIYNRSGGFGLTTNTIILFAFCLVVSIVVSYAYVWMARAFTKQFIWITGILNIVFGLATAIYMLYRKYYSGGVVFLVFTVFFAFAFWSWRSRIPFSVLMLQTSIDVSKKYGHTYLVSAIGGLVAAAFAAWYSVTLVAIYARFEPGANNPACTAQGGCSNAKVIGLIAFTTFAMYWISEWLKNVIHTTISGVYGSWFFCSHNFPKAATRGAFKRAMTYSFGSISLGSLVVAIINCLRQLCSIGQRNASADGNILGCVFFCILQFLIGILDWAVQFINRYAFSYIALYGKSYFASAKATWDMIKNRGVDALINECLIGPVLTMGATFIAYFCAFLAYLYLVYTDPAYNRDGSFTPVVVAFAFLIGLQIANVFTTPLSSGIDTLFVSMAFDPEVLMRDHPDLYARMIAVYPQVQVAIHA